MNKTDVASTSTNSRPARRRWAPAIQCWLPWPTLALLAAMSLLPYGAVAQRQAEVEREGPIANLSGGCPTVEFSVGATVVSTNAATEYDGGACADLRNGQHVEVEGVLPANGRMVAAEVEFDDDDGDDDDGDDDDRDDEDDHDDDD